MLLVTAPHERAAELNHILVQAGVAPAEVRHYEVSLEQYFLALTGGVGTPGAMGAPAYQIEGARAAQGELA